jgi:hypothetical protein
MLFSSVDPSNYGASLRQVLRWHSDISLEISKNFYLVRFPPSCRHCQRNVSQVDAFKVFQCIHSTSLTRLFTFGAQWSIPGTPVKMSELRHFNVSEKLSANQKELQDLHSTWTTFGHTVRHNRINGVLKLSIKCLINFQCLEKVLYV